MMSSRNVRYLAALLLAIAALLGDAGLVAAQTAGLPGGRRLPVHFTAAATPADPRPGEAVTVSVSARLDTGWHLYAPASAAPAGSPATASDIVGLGDWQAIGATVDSAAPEARFDPNFQAQVAYHEGSAILSRAFRVPATAASAAAPATVAFHYQVCNASVCLPPTTAQIPISLTPGKGGVRDAYKNAPTAAAAAPAAAATTTATPAAGAGTTSGSGAAVVTGPWFFLAAAAAGLLALITPCVFPLIPITLASFAKQAGDDSKKLRRLATGYALGVAALYVAVGGVVSVVAGAAGADRLAANPWVNLFAFVVFVVFALSFFETVQIAVPSQLTGAVQSKARTHSGWISLTLLGIVFVLASFTCTAPFVGTLLVASAGGERLRPLLGMTVFALAFTSPFLLFAAFPRSLTRLPKSGAWLARVKATLGFLELAAALKFLSNADLVWQWKLLTQPVLLAAWALLFFLASFYLLGIVRFGVVAETETGAERVSPLRGIFAGLFAGAALYCFWGLSGRPLSPAVATFLPPAGYGATASAGSGDAAAPSDGLDWMTDYDAALAKAKAEGKPLFIDFTGYTCTNCRWNERNVFPDAGVRSELEKFVRVQLYTDGGADGPKNQTLQEKQFGDIALPLYGVVDPATGQVLAKTAGVQSVGGFTTFLRNAQQKATTPAPAAAAAAASPASAAAPLWQPYSNATLAAAMQSGKPVIIDFTADWCVNCKRIEKEVFADPATSARLGKETITLRSDMTQWDAPANAALQQKWNIAALPTIVLIDRRGQEAKSLRITGRLSVADFQKRLDALER